MTYRPVSAASARSEGGRLVAAAPFTHQYSVCARGLSCIQAVDGTGDLPLGAFGGLALNAVLEVGPGTRLWQKLLQRPGRSRSRSWSRKWSWTHVCIHGGHSLHDGRSIRRHNLGPCSRRQRPCCPRRQRPRYPIRGGLTVTTRVLTTAQCRNRLIVCQAM